MYFIACIAILSFVFTIILNSKIDEDLKYMELKFRDLSKDLDELQDKFESLKYFVKTSTEASVKEEPKEEKSKVSCTFSEECDDREDCSRCIWNDAYIPDTSDQLEETEEVEEIDPSHYICPCDDCELGPCNAESPCERFIKWKDSFYPKHVADRCLTCNEFGKLCTGCQGCGQCQSDGSCPADGSVCTELKPQLSCGFSDVDCLLGQCDHHCEK